MKNIFPVFILVFLVLSSQAAIPDSIPPVQSTVLIIPYMPGMHLSDADPDIAEGSQLDAGEMRSALRQGLIKELNRNFSETHDVQGMNHNFVKDGDRDLDVLYHTLQFQSDSVYPLKNPKLFAIPDTTTKKKGHVKTNEDPKYINVAIYDQMLIPDLSKKYDADYLIFLNEIDIKTHFEDCINLALKIYRRDLKVHYSIFDRNGKQVYGDVAVSHFGTNSNDVNEIIRENFPGIAKYILASFDRVVK